MSLTQVAAYVWRQDTSAASAFCCETAAKTRSLVPLVKLNSIWELIIAVVIKLVLVNIRKVV